MSKSAAELMFDTLRLELAPFGIKVTKVMTATVASKSFSYFGNWIMPQNSLYDEVRDKFTRRSNDDDGVPRMDTHEYAEIVA
jgi:1-acylglycerone phosphate reductase